MDLQSRLELALLEVTIETEYREETRNRPGGDSHLKIFKESS